MISNIQLTLVPQVLHHPRSFGMQKLSLNPVRIEQTSYVPNGPRPYTETQVAQIAEVVATKVVSYLHLYRTITRADCSCITRSVDPLIQAGRQAGIHPACLNSELRCRGSQALQAIQPIELTWHAMRQGLHCIAPQDLTTIAPKAAHDCCISEDY